MIILLWMLSVVVAFVVVVWLFMQQTQFGKIAKGTSRDRLVQSPHFKEGKFANLNHTPDFSEGVTITTVMKDYLFKKTVRNRPSQKLPSVKVDLKNIPLSTDAMVWFGHSSYYMQIDGKRFLVDPIFSGAASPVNFTTRSFDGSDVYSVDDIPNIDFLLITHDHWDHLDHKTVMGLKSKVHRIITGLGVGEHLRYWGFSAEIITELDWHQHTQLAEGFELHSTPARHFSGRGFKRAQSIWSSFVLKTPTMKVFVGGDSGHDTHFEMIGEKHGPFDLAILECGQYNVYWKYIHMMPEQTVLAAHQLKSTRLFPMHWAKFALSMHAWDEPIERATAEAEKTQMLLLTPLIGQLIPLKEEVKFEKWWRGVDR